MRGKRFIKIICLASVIAMLVGGCSFLDSLDKVEGGIDDVIEAVDQLERIEDKAMDIFD